MNLLLSLFSRWETEAPGGKWLLEVTSLHCCIILLGSTVVLKYTLPEVTDEKSIKSKSAWVQNEKKALYFKTGWHKPIFKPLNTFLGGLLSPLQKTSEIRKSKS